jgi:hypothetical protein
MGRPGERLRRTYPLVAGRKHPLQKAEAPPLRVGFSGGGCQPSRRLRLPPASMGRRGDEQAVGRRERLPATRAR